MTKSRQAFGPLFGTVIALLLLLAACTQAPEQQPSSPAFQTGDQETESEQSNAETLNFGTVGTLGVAGMAANFLSGAFAKEGIELEIIEHRGVAEGLQALTKGSIDVYLGDITQAAALSQQGQPVKIIASAFDTHVYSLVGRPGSTPDLKALRGKKIGVVGLGSLGDKSLRWLLKTNGLDPEKDVSVSALASESALLDALQGDRVHAAMTTDPHTLLLTNEGYAVIYDFGAQVKPFNSGLFMAKEPWLKENAELARRFLRATFSAVKQLDGDEKTRDNVYQQVFDGVEPQVASLAGKRMNGVWSTAGRVVEADLRAPLELDRLATGQDISIASLNRLIDQAYLP